jgi:arsenate reductase
MKLLFVCTHNACRSILSEVIARELGEGRLETASAGSNPSGKVHPLTLQHLKSHGYSADGLTSKGFAEVESFAPDAVITVCDHAASEPCPIWLGNAVKAHWGLTDPTHSQGSKEEQAENFGLVIATIESRIKALLQGSLESIDAKELEALLKNIGEQNNGRI